MIQCPVCNTLNHHLSVVCIKCGSYIQNKIENLDLFSTIWNIIERPGPTFHKIAIAAHKNYTYILSGVTGIGYIFFIFWIVKAGDYTNSLLNFLIAGILIGVPLGIITVVFYCFILIVVSRLLRVKISFRNAQAVIAYAMVPVVISVFIILPIEVMTFGLFFFSKNPSPYIIKPFSYIVLLVLDGLFSLWTLFLLWKGVKILTDKGWIFNSLILLVSLSVLVGSYYFLINYLMLKIG